MNQGQTSKPEASTLSMSQVSGIDASMKKDLVNGQMHLIDHTFPLFYEIHKRTKLPLFCYKLLMIIVIIQIILLSFWFSIPGFLESGTIAGDIAYWLSVCLMFTSYGEETTDLLPFMIASIAGALIFVMSIIIQMIIFKQHRRFNKKSLFVTRFFLEFFPELFLIPVANFTGQSFYLAINNGGIFILYITIGVISFAGFASGHYIKANIFSGTSYISSAPISAWSGHVHFMMFIGISIFPLVSYALLFFAGWVRYFLFAARIAFSVIMIWQTCYFPFIYLESDAAVAAIFTCTIPIEAISIVKFAGIHIELYIQIIVAFLSFIISMIVWGKIFEILLRKRAHRLNDNYLEEIEVDPNVPDVNPAANPKFAFATLTDMRKRTLFEQLKINKKHMAHLYLRVGIATGTARFIDWSLIKYVAESHQNAEMLSTICQFVAFFPSESRLLNYFFILACAQAHHTIRDRFILFSVHKIKTLRQSSASSEVTEKIMSMKTASMRGIRAVRSFWDTVPKDISLMYNIHNYTVATSYLFEEAIDMWPNNSRFCDEYSTFLCECATNFTKSLALKNRSDLIEQGKNFVVDLSFRSLVQAYNLYLKKNIVDIKGRLIANKPAGQGGASQFSSNNGSSNMSSMNSSTMNYELEAEVEDRLAKAFFSHHRLRLAFQKSLDNRKSHNSKYLKYASCFTLLAVTIIIVVLFAWLFDIFEPREVNMYRQRVLNNLRYGYDASFLTIYMHFLHKLGFISDSLLGNASGGLAMPSPKTNNYNLQFSTERHPYNTTLVMNHQDFAFMDEAQRWILYTRDNLDQFISSVIDLAASGDNVNVVMNNMINPVVPFDFCIQENNDTHLLGNSFNESLRSEIVYIGLKLANLTQYNYVNATGWNKDKGLCEAITNTNNMFNAFDGLTLTLSANQERQNEQVHKEIIIVFIIVAVIYLVVIMPPLFFFLYKSVNELYYLLDAMSKFDKSVKEEAGKPFRPINETDQDVMSHTSGQGHLSKWFLNLNIVIFSLLAILMIGIVIIVSLDMNDSFLELNQWLFYGISRLNYMLESFAYTCIAITIAKDPELFPYVSLDDIFAIGVATLNNLVEYNNNILRGSEELASTRGQNARLDQLHYDDDCHGNLNLGGFHDLYRCANIDRGINLLVVLLRSMLDDPSNVTLALDNPFYHAFHLMNDHLIDPTYEASMILTTLATDQIQKFHAILSGISFGGIALLAIIFAIFLTNILRIDSAYAGCMQLMRRVPPNAVVSNQKLLMYLLNKKDDHSQTKMTVPMKIILQSKDAILCLAKNGSIEVVTKSVTMTFGYTPEQLLGQSLSVVLPEEQNPTLFEQMQLMGNGEASLTFDTAGEFINDNDQPISVHITLFGTPENGTKVAKSFTVVIRDITELIEQRQKAEEAKKKSEDLLYQILPRDIVNRLNQGEKDISFSVPSASVIFIDIVKFSDYAANLTPAQIMENLSMVFAAFDNSASKYDLITKIKLIGDVYMAAANLFTQDDNPQPHATQTIQFALDVLNDLEEVNAALDSSLQVRIGINTDGPLIAGVLGTDKPVFDIIGDPINVAARLQSNAFSNTIQISQTTYDAVSGMNFNIEQRGLIDLKGKGKRMAYIVRPSEGASFLLPDNLSSAPEY